MSWWDFSRRELIYNRLHAFTVYSLLGITLISTAFLGYSSYQSIVADKDRKEQFAEGKLPSKS